MERTKILGEEAYRRLVAVRELIRDDELKVYLGIADETLHLALGRFEFEWQSHESVFSERRAEVVDWFGENAIDDVTSPSGKN